MYRYELKYAIHHLSAAAVLQEILQHPVGFTTAFPDRQVNNIYLDTPAFDCFHQNVDGHPRRSKMRLRWYGTDANPQPNSILEIKHKKVELGWKDHFPLDGKQVHTAVELLAAIRTLRPNAAQLIPTLHNSYHRSYFLSKDGLFRLTIDSNQTFKRPFLHQPSIPVATYPIVLELKYDRQHADRSREITDFISFRQTKNSKYTTGISSLYY